MLRFALRKVARAVAVMLLVTFATFTLMYGNAPGIARGVLGIEATPAAVQAEVVRLGLNQPATSGTRSSPGSR